MSAFIYLKLALTFIRPPLLLWLIVTVWRAVLCMCTVLSLSPVPNIIFSWNLLHVWASRLCRVAVRGFLLSSWGYSSFLRSFTVFWWFDGQLNTLSTSSLSPFLWNTVVALDQDGLIHTCSALSPADFCWSQLVLWWLAESNPTSSAICLLLEKFDGLLKQGPGAAGLHLWPRSPAH